MFCVPRNTEIADAHCYAAFFGFACSFFAVYSFVTVLLSLLLVQEADCKKMVDIAVSTYGGLHVAFNNHGIYQTNSFAEMTDEMATSLLDINLKSLIFCFKYEVWKLHDGCKALHFWNIQSVNLVL